MVTELFPVIVGETVEWALAIPSPAQIVPLPPHRKLTCEELALMMEWVDVIRREDFVPFLQSENERRLL